MAEIAPLKRIIEAALLASTQPLTLPQLSALFDEFDMPPQDELARALEELGADCAERGVELVEVASGFRYQVRHDVHAHVSRLWSERPSRYSRALLETLCLIAYRQPITRAEIEQIRGVAVSTNIVRTLEEREWVRVVGYRDLPGKPALFGTTKQFLDYFNLKSLDQLPPLSDIREIEDLDPEFAFGTQGPILATIAAGVDADFETADATSGDEAGEEHVHEDIAHYDPTQTDSERGDASEPAHGENAARESTDDPIEPDSTQADSTQTDPIEPDSTNPAPIKPDPADAERDDESDPASSTTTTTPSTGRAPDPSDTSA